MIHVGVLIVVSCLYYDDPTSVVCAYASILVCGMRKGVGSWYYINLLHSPCKIISVIKISGAWTHRPYMCPVQAYNHRLYTIYGTALMCCIVSCCAFYRWHSQHSDQQDSLSPNSARRHLSSRGQVHQNVRLKHWYVCQELHDNVYLPLVVASSCASLTLQGR